MPKKARPSKATAKTGTALSMKAAKTGKKKTPKAKAPGKKVSERKGPEKQGPEKKGPEKKGAAGFSLVVKNILKSKGVSDAQIRAMDRKGIQCREDFAQIGDPGTLADLVGLPQEIADKVMVWACSPTGSGGGQIIVDASDVVYCAHCKTKQPKDYKSGDLCVSCGKQVEPILSCYWCQTTGPGKFCRQCGAEFVPTGELELALLLKRDGLPKDAIPARLRKMTASEKEALWGRVRVR
ncbi:MAG: hypothetical protein AB1486_17925 [Planctomycetota bacterium]